MKKRFFLIAFLLAANSPVSHAAFYDGKFLATQIDAYTRAEEGRAYTSDFQRFTEVLAYIAATSDSLEGRGLLCAAEDARIDQFVEVVRKYLKAHPEAWGKSGYEIVAAALLQAFGCPPKPKDALLALMIPIARHDNRRIN